MGARPSPVHPPSCTQRHTTEPLRMTRCRGPSPRGPLLKAHEPELVLERQIADDPDTAGRSPFGRKEAPGQVVDMHLCSKSGGNHLRRNTPPFSQQDFGRLQPTLIEVLLFGHTCHELLNRKQRVAVRKRNTIEGGWEWNYINRLGELERSCVSWVSEPAPRGVWTGAGDMEEFILIHGALGILLRQLYVEPFPSAPTHGKLKVEP